MAGLQTMLLNNLTYDGQCATAEVWLVKEGKLDTAVVVLGKLQQRAYAGEVVVFAVPSHLKPMEADSVAIYCVETKAVLSWGKLQ